MKEILQSIHDLTITTPYTIKELQNLYILESLARRVAISEYKDEFVLRGGMMSRHWYAPGKWMPSDIDFMVQEPLQQEDMVECWQDILGENQLEDGIQFHAEEIRSAVIWVDAKDPGLRLWITASLEKVVEQFDIQIDISYSDPTVPVASFQEYPSIFPEQSFTAKMVHRETSAGWKFYGLFERVKERWRAKDLFGLYWMLTRESLNINYVLDSYKETSIERGTN